MESPGDRALKNQVFVDDLIVALVLCQVFGAEVSSTATSRRRRNAAVVVIAVASSTRAAVRTVSDAVVAFGLALSQTRLCDGLGVVLNLALRAGSVFAVVVARSFLESTGKTALKNEILVHDLIVALVLCQVFGAKKAAASRARRRRNASDVVIVKSGPFAIQLRWEKRKHSSYLPGLQSGPFPTPLLHFCLHVWSHFLAASFSQHEYLHASAPCSSHSSWQTVLWKTSVVEPRNTRFELTT